jgi:WD40 repeat protein
MIKHTLEGHRKHVYCIATSRDGKRIASGSEDKTVRIWDSETGQLKFTIDNQDAGVLCLSFSKNGSTVVSGCSDGRIKVWELRDADGAQLLRTQHDHAAQVEDVKVSPDGTRLASSCEEGPVVISDMQTGARVWTLAAHASAVFCVAWSPDGELVASAGEDGHVIVWRARDGTQEVGPLKGHKSSVTCVVFFNTCSKHFVSAGGDKCIVIWELLGNGAAAEKHRLKGHAGTVESISLSPNDRFLVSGSRDMSVRVWETATGLMKTKLEGHAKWARTVVWLAQGRYIVSGGDDKTVRVWEMHHEVCNCVFMCVCVLDGEVCKWYTYMYVYVCMYIYIYVCMYVCMHDMHMLKFYSIHQYIPTTHGRVV